MNNIFLETINLYSWDETLDPKVQQQAITALESGKIVYLPKLEFKLLPHEKPFLSPAITSLKRKNVSYDLVQDKIRGFDIGIDQIQLQEMMRRYATNARSLLNNILPSYSRGLIHARTSYRPVEIAGRIPKSYRKDDTRLHVDAFPANPTQGKRILRMFSNVNPQKPRVWKVGEPFDNVVQRFGTKIRQPLPGLNKLLHLSRITKSYRTLYDHYMLHIHDSMKADLKYQGTVKQQEIHFPPGSTWLVYTDQVSHAALSGQFLFEQTFHLPVTSLFDKRSSPLHVLEQYLNAKLC